MAKQQAVETFSDAVETIKGWEKPNAKRARALIERFSELDELDTSPLDALEEYESLDRSDFDDAEEYRDAREEAWDGFLESLDETEEEWKEWKVQQAVEDPDEEELEAIETEDAPKAAPQPKLPTSALNAKPVAELTAVDRATNVLKSGMLKLGETTAIQLKPGEDRKKAKNAIHRLAKAMGMGVQFNTEKENEGWLSMTLQAEALTELPAVEPEKETKVSKKAVRKEDKEDVETVVTMNAGSKNAEVYTEEAYVQKRLEELGYKAESSKQKSGGKTYVIPKSALIFGAPNGTLRTTRNGKLKKVSTMSEEQRKAAGVRMQTARANKIGEAMGYTITLEQFRALKLRPGAMPTEKDLDRVGAQKLAKKAKK